MTDFLNLDSIYNYALPWLLKNGLTILLIFIVALVVNKFSDTLIEKFIRKIIPSNKYSGSPLAERKREDTLIRITTATVKVVTWLVVSLMVLSELGVNIGPLIAAAGVAGIAFGFGGQYLIKDLISGFFIILENQYRIGDVVCFDDTCGLVEDITLRATILRDLDGVVHHVPHGTINRVSNLAKQFARVNLNLSISYKANLEQVITVVNTVGAELANDPDWQDSILKPIIFERVEDFADSAVIIKVLGDTAPLRQWAVAGEFRKRIKIAFDKERIEIPLPQRVIHSA